VLDAVGAGAHGDRVVARFRVLGREERERAGGRAGGDRGGGEGARHAVWRVLDRELDGAVEAAAADQREGGRIALALDQAHRCGGQDEVDRAAPAHGRIGQAAAVAAVAVAVAAAAGGEGEDKGQERQAPGRFPDRLRWDVHWLYLSDRWGHRPRAAARRTRGSRRLQRRPPPRYTRRRNAREGPLAMVLSPLPSESRPEERHRITGPVQR